MGVYFYLVEKDSFVFPKRMPMIMITANMIKYAMTALPWAKQAASIINIQPARAMVGIRSRLKNDKSFSFFIIIRKIGM